MVKAAILAPASSVAYVYGDARRVQLARMAELLPGVVEPGELETKIDLLRDVEVLFSTWGMPALTPEQLDRLPALRVLFYAAGSVHGFAPPILARGITIVSAWRANGLPVARFALAQTILAMKGYFRNVREYRGDPAGWQRSAFMGPGPYEETVALLGAGAVGRAFIELLKPLGVRIIVFDPFLDEAGARALGAEKVGLGEAFAQGFVVSNHLADKPEIAGMIDAALLGSMREGAVFINTARGRTVNEADLARAMADRPDLTALLDVTHPEPVDLETPLMKLPNVQISTHMAGAINREVGVLADRCIEEFGRYLRGEPLRDTVTEEMLATLA